MRCDERKILFVAGNSDTQLKSFLPLIIELSKFENIKISVLYSINFPKKIISREDNATEKDIKNLVDEFYIYDQDPSMLRGYGSLIGNLFLTRDYQKKISQYIASTSPDIIVLPNNKIFRNRFIYKYAAINSIYTCVIQDTLNPGGMGNVKSYTKKVRVKLLIHNIFNYLLNSFGALGILNYRSLFKFNRGHKKIGFIAVWGKNSKKIALENKYNLEQIKVTGQPRFDEIINNDWSGSSNVIYNDLKIKLQSKKIVFLPTKGITNEYFAKKDEQLLIYTSLIDSINRVSKDVNISIKLIIKLHRDEDIDSFKKMFTSKKLMNVSITQDNVLYPILSECDLAITTASTAGLEALIFDNPLITVNFSKTPDFYSYSSSGAAIGVYDVLSFEPAIKRALFDKKTIHKLRGNRVKYVINEAHTQDGNSTKRVLRAIDEVLVNS